MEDKSQQIGKDVPPEEGLHHILMRGFYAGLGIAVLAVLAGVYLLGASRDVAFTIFISALFAGVLLSIGLVLLQQSRPTSPRSRAIAAAATLVVAWVITAGIVCYALVEIYRIWDHPPAPNNPGPPELPKFEKSDGK